MLRIAIVFLAATAIPSLCLAQFGGNVVYSDNERYSDLTAKEKAARVERLKRVISEHDLPPSAGSMFVEANVLLNMKADEYVAVFAVAQEGKTTSECSQKMNVVLKDFTEALRPLGIGAADSYVDFIAQTKIYGYDVTNDTAREKLVGYELKKNVSLRFTDQQLQDKLLAAAAKVQIFDLVKVDYVLKDTAKVQNRLMEEAARVIKQKTGRYEKLLGAKLQGPPQIYAERSAIHYPTQLYDSYKAEESENIDHGYLRSNFTVHNLRKSRSFHFNGLDASGFDEVINPVIIEPVVQCTLYLKVKYELEPGKGK